MKTIFALFAIITLLIQPLVALEPPQTRELGTNVQALLDLIVNSLYTNKEIFLRELISNSADALDKLRYHGLGAPDLLQTPYPLSVRIAADPASNTLTIADNGIGMTEGELVQYLGNIAESGTRRFAAAKAAAGEGAGEGAGVTADTPSGVRKQNGLIGQFGVGFYSAFLVADHIDVTSVSYTAPNKAFTWSSDGSSTYTVGETELAELSFADFDDFIATHGTKIVLHLRDLDDLDLLTPASLETLAARYSAFLAYPIYIHTPAPAPEAEAEAEAEAEEGASGEATWERVSDVEPLWRRDPDNLTDTEYRTFYETALQPTFFGSALSKNSADNGSAAHWTHFSVEADMGDFRALMYVPAQAPIDYLQKLRQNEVAPGVDLYVRRVFVASTDRDGNQLLPRCLNFVRGVVDADAVDIHVSRELLQDSRALRQIRKTLLRKALSMLTDLSEGDRYEHLADNNNDNYDPEDYPDHIEPGVYASIYRTFEASIKSCASELRDDKKSMSVVMDLLRFASTRTDELTAERAAARTTATKDVRQRRDDLLLVEGGPRPTKEADETDDEFKARQTAYNDVKTRINEAHPLPSEEDIEYRPVPSTSLRAYVERMPVWQSDIYAVFGYSLEHVRNNPAIEAAAKRGIEVLLCPDPFDEAILIDLIQKYDGHKIVSITNENTVLPENPDTKNSQDNSLYATYGVNETLAPLIDYLTAQIAPHHDVERVVVSSRLVSSPAVLVTSSSSMVSPVRAKLIAANGGIDPRVAEMFKVKRVLEINPDHPVITSLNARVAAAATAARSAPRNVSDAGLHLAADLLVDGAAHRSGFDVVSYEDFMSRITEAATKLGAPEDAGAAEEALRGILEKKAAEKAAAEKAEKESEKKIEDVVMDDIVFDEL